MMENEIIVPNFFRVGINGDKSIRKNDLGGSESSKRDAQSDYPESIFRYFVEIVGLNILFYYVKDRQFYTIETEKFPIEVRRIFPNPNWDGIIDYLPYKLYSIYVSTSSATHLADIDSDSFSSATRVLTLSRYLLQEECDRCQCFCVRLLDISYDFRQILANHCVACLIIHKQTGV